ncbi:MAG: N-acetylmuramoyl-L-alanine amidase, partial [Sinomicrobium sp.]|nr:N-acetylmuramoyl-L-alanine amidase [Sinomicrobium sp.]
MKKTHDQFILMDINTFAEWLKGQRISRPVERIQNHHTWKPDYANFRGDNHFNLLEGMRNSHLKRGFSDIAQNITTFPDGALAVCRPLERTPAGIKGANTGGICIEHLGNFDAGGDTMTKAHANTVIYLNALLCAEFKLNPDTDSIVYHHWWDLNTGRRTNGEGVTKSCPGNRFFGGNTVADAERYFIPKIKAWLEAMKA